MQIIDQKDIQDNVEKYNLDFEHDQSEVFPFTNHQMNILSRNAVDKLQVNIQSSITKLNQLLMKAQDITLENHRNQDLCSKAVQVIQVASIGLMQILNIKQLLEKKDLAVEQSVSCLNITCTTNQLNQYSTNLVLDYMNHIILEKILELIEKFSQLQKEQKRSLAIYLAKFQSCIEILPGATTVKHDDLYAIPQDHQNWLLINPYIEKKQLATEEQIKKSYEKVSFGILLGNAMISKGSEYSGELQKSFMEGFGAIYYGLNKKKMKSRADHFLVEAKQEDAFKAWNLPETGIIKKFLPAIFPSISFNKKIYIPKLFRKITKEYIFDQYNKGTINKINNDCGVFFPEQMITMDELLKNDLNQDRVQVRVLCHESLKLKGQDGFMSMFKSTRGKEFSFDKIVIHIHGGGFVAMSSRSHQTYTRKWANNMKVPIFSIDYKMAPDHPYPAGLDDCWQAYMFIITFIHKYFNIVPSKVVLVGDSAGGNLVAALTIQAIKAGVRVPDGIVKQVFQEFLTSIILAYYTKHNFLIKNPNLNSYIQNLKMLLFFKQNILLHQAKYKSKYNRTISCQHILLYLQIQYDERRNPNSINNISQNILNLNKRTIYSIKCIKTFTPSFLVSLDDSLLHHTVLKLCLNSYVMKEFNSTIDPMLSPSAASEEILKLFPKTRIVVGTYDPLHDESLRLLLKLVQQQKDVKLIEYQSMPHGFLSFDFINGMKEAKQTVIDAQNCLLEMLN